MTGVAVLVALVILLIDTVSVNLAANLVGPAYDFSALAPKHISYRMGIGLSAETLTKACPDDRQKKQKQNSGFHNVFF